MTTPNAANLKPGNTLYTNTTLGPTKLKVVKVTSKYVHLVDKSGQRTSVRVEDLWLSYSSAKPTQEELDDLYMWSGDSDRPLLEDW